jgi:putative hydrolase of the HAD superfamily
MFDLIAFDGDDTLWHNERFYRMGRERFNQVLARAGLERPAEEVERLVNETELRNIKYYGYGVTSFVLSLIETAIEVTDGRISGTDIFEFVRLSKEMLTARVELFDGGRRPWQRLPRPTRSC